jgi:hypothetical protein
VEAQAPESLRRKLAKYLISSLPSPTNS